MERVWVCLRTSRDEAYWEQLLKESSLERISIDLWASLGPPEEAGNGLQWKEQ